MQKLIILILVLLACSISCRAQVNAEDRTDHTQDKSGLKGRVKSEVGHDVPVYSFSAKDTNQKEFANYYDTAGHMLEHYRYFSKRHKVELAGKYRFDARGYLVGLYEMHYDYRGDSNGRTCSYVNDKDGNTIDDTCYDASDMCYQNDHFKYDSGKIKERYIYRDCGMLDKRITYRYNSKGKPAEENWYNKDGSPWSKTVYKYDKGGYTVEKRFFTKKGTVDELSIKKYDTLGRMILYVNNDVDGKVRRTYQYKNKGGGQQVDERGGDGKLRSRRTSFHYDFGNYIADYSVETDYEMKNTRKYLIEQETDSMGNWIRESRCENPGGPFEYETCIRRVIEYYK